MAKWVNLYKNKEYTTDEISRMIKKLNWRLADYEKNNVTDTQGYKALKQVADALNEANKVPEKERVSASGYTRIRNTPKLYNKADIDKISNVTEWERQGRHNTRLTELNRKSRELFGKEWSNISTEQKISVRVGLVRDEQLHQFIIKHSEDIYLLDGMKSALKDKARLTDAEAEKIWKMYENPENYAEDGTFLGDMPKPKP